MPSEDSDEPRYQRSLIQMKFIKTVFENNNNNNNNNNNKHIQE